MPEIQIDDNRYIQVDNYGYCDGVCPEGVLGAILSIRVANRPGARLALKIPRLLADTIEENTYICSILEAEAKAVYDIFLEGSKKGLVQCRDVEEEKGVLVKARKLSLNTAINASRQNGHVIFVSFEKGKNPRICSVDFGPTGLSVYPEGAKSDIDRVINQDTWNRMKGETGVYAAFQRSAYTALFESSAATSKDGGSVSAGLLESSTQPDRPLQAWYAGIPSIIFDWARGNLQEAVANGYLKDWAIDKHLELFIEVLEGINCLHGRGMLHGDIRPANIMALGDPGVPDSYELGDYGGFQTDAARNEVRSSESDGSGRTRIGPVLGRGRVSPFYAPERRAGVERESADVALIMRGKKNAGYFIWVGWRSELIDAKTGFPNPQKIEEIRAIETQLTAQKGVADPDSLWPGDRLRLRDYVFEIIHAEIYGQSQVDGTRGNLCCVCKGRFFRVIHDRMTIVDEGPGLKDPEVISLAQYAEYRQWSAATDLYGVGALCLYCLFVASRQKKPKPGDSSHVIDAEFTNMMSVLESIPYFGVFWGQLEQVRSILESLDADKMTAEDAVSYKKNPKDKELKAVVANAVNNMVQSAPGVRTILATFNWNMAHFVLFMHFVLSCLHRLNHLEETARKFTENKGAQAPFCLDRAEKPRENGPASRALSRLGDLRELFKKEVFRGFLVKDDVVPDFDPRSDFLVRLDDAELSASLRRIIDQGRKVEIPRWGEARANIIELARRISEAEAILKSIEARAYNLPAASARETAPGSDKT